jgi:DNA-binding transcriptional ArsR family regulator
MRSSDSMSVERDTRARVVDVSRPGGELAVEVAVAEAAELLLSLAVIVGDNDPDTYTLGAARIEELRASVAPDLHALADEVLLGAGKSAVMLLGLAYSTPKPRTADAFVRRISTIDPLDLQLHRLGYHARGHHVAEPETIRRAASGDGEAQRELLDAASEWTQKHAVLERLLDLGPERAQRGLLELVSRWQREVFPALATEAGPLAERDAESKRPLASSLPPERVVERFVPGLQYAPTPDVHRIALFPAYVSRPWVYMCEHRHVKIFCYPIGVDLEETAPGDPADLVRVYKALADETRLRLLKRLQAGPITLAEATEETGLAKSTTHHHLAILRQAGFVLIREDDDLYSLRSDVTPEPGALLARFLGSTAQPVARPREVRRAPAARARRRG